MLPSVASGAPTGEGGEPACADCRLGEHNVGLGAKNCMRCSPGLYTLVAGSTTSDNCPSGKIGAIFEGQDEQLRRPYPEQQLAWSLAAVAHSREAASLDRRMGAQDVQACMPSLAQQLVASEQLSPAATGRVDTRRQPLWAGAMPVSIVTNLRRDRGACEAA